MINRASCYCPCRVVALVRFCAGHETPPNGGMVSVERFERYSRDYCPDLTASPRRWASGVGETISIPASPNGNHSAG